jgi:hypothetical protein
MLGTLLVDWVLGTYFGSLLVLIIPSAIVIISCVVLLSLVSLAFERLQLVLVYHGMLAQ